LATMALEIYDLPDQSVLFLKNVIGGFYAIMDSDAISLRFEEMQEAADVYKDAFQMGLGLMVGYLVSGKDENEKYVLTELVRC